MKIQYHSLFYNSYTHCFSNTSEGCKHIRRIVFHKASYLDDAGLEQLPLLKDSLEELQISSCGNVTEEGLRHLKQLK